MDLLLDAPPPLRFPQPRRGIVDLASKDVATCRPRNAPCLQRAHRRSRSTCIPSYDRASTGDGSPFDQHRTGRKGVISRFRHVSGWAYVLLAFVRIDRGTTLE